MEVLTSETFEEYVFANAERLVMVQFEADWDPLADSMAEVLQNVENSVGDQMGAARLDVGLPENAELVHHLGLTHLPALMFIFRQRVVDYRVGFSRVRFVQHVQQLMRTFHPYLDGIPVPWNPGPFPSGIVLAPHDPAAEEPGGDHFGTHPGTAAAGPGRSPYDPPISGPSATGYPPMRFGLIPFQLPVETVKRSLWDRIRGR